MCKAALTFGCILQHFAAALPKPIAICLYSKATNLLFEPNLLPKLKSVLLSCQNGTAGLGLSNEHWAFLC
jgi:hypothetical protein